VSALFSAFLSTLAGCHTQDDLYALSSPVLRVKSDWSYVPGWAGNETEAEAGTETETGAGSRASGQATVMLFGEGGEDGEGGEVREVRKTFLNSSSSVELPITRGEYDVLVSNGLFQSENITPLDHVWFRGTGNLETFEAVVAEVTPNRFLSRAEGEYIASCSMEILASAQGHVSIEGENRYYLKYRDGENGWPEIPNYAEQEITLIPWPVSYVTRIAVSVANPESMARLPSGSPVISAALRGFSGSVFNARRRPNPDFLVTHQTNLNSYCDTGENLGQVEASFVSFGPPLDRRPGYECSLEIFAGLVDGSEVRRTFSLDEAVSELIDRIEECRAGELPITMTIPIEIDLALPEVEPSGGGGSFVGVNPWEDIEVPVVIKF
jgi:hypothetical protein